MTATLLRSKYAEAGLLLAAIFFAFFWNIWGFPLFDLDEGAFSEATREMLANRNFAATYLDGEPRYDKPILSYWFQALSVSLFNLSEFSLRLPSAIAATLWLLACYSFARQQWDRASAMFIVLIMANTLWIGIIGKAAIADAWLNLFITLTVLDIWRYWQDQRRTLLFRVYLWMALGLLTKGPVAVLIPLLVSGIFFVWQGHWQRWLKAIFYIPGWILLLVILTPWLYLVYEDQGIGFFRGFLLEHNLERFSSTREGHGGNLFYYVVALPLVLLPFSGALFSLLKNVRSYFREPLALYLLIWLAVVFTLVSFSGTQLPHYVVYGITGILLLFARYREQLFASRLIYILPVLFFGLMVALPWLLDYASANTRKLYDQQMLAQVWDVISWQYYVGSVAALIITVWLAVTPKWSNSGKIVAIGFAQTLFMFGCFIHLMADLQQGPIKQAAEIARQMPDAHIIAYGLHMPSFSVYRDAITPGIEPSPGDVIFTDSDNYLKLQRQNSEVQFREIYQQGGILLVEWSDAQSDRTD